MQCTAGMCSESLVELYFCRREWDPFYKCTDRKYGRTPQERRVSCSVVSCNVWISDSDDRNSSVEMTTSCLLLSFFALEYFYHIRNVMRVVDSGAIVEPHFSPFRCRKFPAISSAPHGTSKSEVAMQEHPIAVEDRASTPNGKKYILPPTTTAIQKEERFGNGIQAPLAYVRRRELAACAACTIALAWPSLPRSSAPTTLVQF